MFSQLMKKHEQTRLVSVYSASGDNFWLIHASCNMKKWLFSPSTTGGTLMSMVENGVPSVKYGATLATIDNQQLQRRWSLKVYMLTTKYKCPY
jgi:hypothetical protein